MKRRMYKVPFTGYCEVYACDSDEATDLADDPEKHHFEHYDYGEPICLEKEEEDD